MSDQIVTSTKRKAGMISGLRLSLDPSAHGVILAHRSFSWRRTVLVRHGHEIANYSTFTANRRA